VEEESLGTVSEEQEEQPTADRTEEYLAFLTESDGADERPASEFLAKDVALANLHRRKRESVWGRVPEQIFKSYILPYRIATESPSEWRERFHNRFWNEVNAMTLPDAVKHLNREAFSYLNVTYKKDYPGHKPDQNPFESEHVHFASCTGLSIILASACRSVGIPARMAMTPAWVQGSDPSDGKDGLSDVDQNHSWVEVYLGDDWHYIGASEDSDFDRTWFSGQAAKARPATKADTKHSIYAVTFEKSYPRIPAPWTSEEDKNKGVNVIDITSRYAK